MSGWGKAPEGIKEITSITAVGEGSHPKNLDVMIAANAAVSGLDMDCKDCNAHVPSNTKGGGRGL